MMTSERANRMVLLLTALIVGLPTLAGCDNDPVRSGGATVLIIGNRQNAPRPQLGGDARAAVNDAILRGDHLVIISESGTPSKVDDSPAAECLGINGIACTKRRKNLQLKIADVVDDYPATTEGSSLLKALSLARESVEGDSGAKHFIVIDNGIDTAGPLPMTDLSLLDWDRNQLVDDVAKHQSLPDLTGVSVLMTGLGSVAAPQKALSDQDGARLAELWTALLSRSGATIEKPLRMSATPSVGARTDISPAPAVPVARRPKAPPPIDVCGVYKLNEAQLGFRSDRASFVSAARAKRAMRDYARVLKNSGLAVLVTGTTAYPETKPGNPLSNARASAVKKLLVDSGVPRSRIRTQGVGINWTGYRDPSGHLTAEVKMRLVLLRADCP